MSETKGRSELQGLYGALLGGLMSSFVGLAVFYTILGRDSELASSGLLIAVLIGLGCAIAFMVGGLYASVRLPWLGGSLFFASGFTTLWSIPASFGAEPRWVVLLALGIAIVIGVVIGSRRFGGKAPTSSGGESGRESGVWVTPLSWAIGAAILSSMLGIMCVTLAAALAMALETGATRAVGIAINLAALGLMVGSYTAVLVVVMRYLAGRRDVPRTVWLGLVVFPLAWGLLMSTSPAGMYEVTPLIVNGVGLVVAWFVVGRHGQPRRQMAKDTKGVAWTH